MSPKRKARESPTLAKYKTLFAPSNRINPMLAVVPISAELHSFFTNSFVLMIKYDYFLKRIL